MKPRKTHAAILIAALAASNAGAENAMPQLIDFDERPRAFGEGVSAQNRTPAGDSTLAQLRRDPRVSELQTGRSAAHAAVKTKGFTLSLSNAREVAHVEELEVTSKDGTTHLYRYDTETGNETSIIVHGDDMLGRVRVGDDTWRLTPLGDGLTAVFRYETSTIKEHPEGWEDLVGGGGTASWLESARRNLIERNEQSTGDTPAQTTIDVLVAYTSGANAVAGATATSIDMALEAMFAYTNRIFKRSGSDTRMRLVHTAHVGYKRSSSMVDDLCRLTAQGETWGDLVGCIKANATRPEALDELHRLRKTHDADLVALAVGRPARGGFSGIAWIAPNDENYGFSVFALHAELAGTYVFAHEIGHNLGGGHNPGRATRENGQPWRPYGHGRCNTEERWHTVMSYSNAGPPKSKPCGRRTRIPLFSSPDVTGPRGTPTGDTHTHNVVRLIEESTETVTKYRGHEFAHFVPFMPGTRLQKQGVSGYVRIVNASTQGGRIAIKATDDAGNIKQTSIWIGGFKTREFKSKDLEAGNTGGLREGIGRGTGHRRLLLESNLLLAVRGYVQTHDGLLINTDKTEEHVQSPQGRISGIRFFNPGSVEKSQSVLRIINPYARRIDVEVYGIDDKGRWGDEPVKFELGARRAINIGSGTLEEGPSFAEGALGDGAGKWRLLVATSKRVHVMSLLFSNTGYVSNLSH